MHASMDVKVQRPMFTIRGPQNAEGIPISLGKWGWGGPHITRDMGTGVPISRGSPYRAYTGTRFQQPVPFHGQLQWLPDVDVGFGNTRLHAVLSTQFHRDINNDNGHHYKTGL